MCCQVGRGGLVRSHHLVFTLQRAACVSGRVRSATERPLSVPTWMALRCASASPATFSSTRWITPAEVVMGSPVVLDAFLRWAGAGHAVLAGSALASTLGLTGSCYLARNRNEYSVPLRVSKIPFKRITEAITGVPFLLLPVRGS